jgi:hypothetical protein
MSRLERNGILMVATFLVLVTMTVAAQNSPETRRAAVAPPPVPTPVGYFRQLLAAKGEERDKLLAVRPVEQRSKFRSIIQEYERCTPEEREKRLQALELRFVITSMLKMAPAARTQALERLNVSVRSLVRDRLEYWDKLAPDVQRKLLENERLISIITRVEPGVFASRPGTLGSNELGRVESAVRSWNQSLPEEKRATAEEAFRRLFEAGVAAASPITPLSPSEHDEMQRVLARFKHLTPAQRSACVRNFSKLAQLSPAERETFLRSADEWQRMSADDRLAWKSLVKSVRVLPPMPPGLRTLPPLPVPSVSIFQTATNASE